MLRIIAGELGGRRLRAPAGLATRPTTDRVREALFNILVSSPLPLYGGTVLDLYAGSGALGIEALSRGAGHCTFVEADARLAAALRATLARLNVANAEVRNEPAERFLAAAASPFDVAFVDPPFAQSLWASSLDALQSRGWLKPVALVYVEAPVGTEPGVPAGWTLHRESRAGDVRFALYRASRGLPAGAGLG